MLRYLLNWDYEFSNKLKKHLNQSIKIYLDQYKTSYDEYYVKCWFNVLFGMNLKNPTKAPFDLNIKEFYIIGSCFLFLFLFTFFVNYYL
mgnify:CR=1 FL=1